LVADECVQLIQIIPIKLELSNYVSVTAKKYVLEFL